MAVGSSSLQPQRVEYTYLSVEHITFENLIRISFLILIEFQSELVAIHRERERKEFERGDLPPKKKV